MFVFRKTTAVGLWLLATCVMAGVPDVTTTRFTSHVLEKSNARPVVVEYYADWCGFCRRQAPVFAQMAHEYADRLTFVRVNIEKDPDLASLAGVRGLPSVIVFEAGMPLSRLQGLSTAAQMREVFDSYVPR